MSRLTTIALLLVSFLSIASDKEQANLADDELVTVDQWHLSVALGAGVITNPLHGGKNIPLVVLPNIHFYGEQFFIENNVVGYSLLQTQHMVISGIMLLNRERAFFSDWKPAHLALPLASNSDFYHSEKNYQSVDTVDKRRWAIDAGMQINLFINSKLEAKLEVLHDINSVYNGFNSNMVLFYNTSLSHSPKTKLRLAVGALWQSEQLIDYYYGAEDDTQIYQASSYEASSGFNPYLSLNIRHPLNENWQLSSYLKYEYLGDHLKDSALVESDEIITAFAGVVYAF